MCYSQSPLVCYTLSCCAHNHSQESTIFQPLKKKKLQKSQLQLKYSLQDIYIGDLR